MMQNYATCLARFQGTHRQCSDIESWLLMQDINTRPVRVQFAPPPRSEAIMSRWQVRFNWPHALAMPSANMVCFAITGVTNVVVTWRI